MESILVNYAQNFISILVDCPDVSCRTAAQTLITFVLKRLLDIEKDYFTEWEKIEVESLDANGEKVLVKVD